MNRRNGEDAFATIPEGARLPAVWALPLIAVALIAAAAAALALLGVVAAVATHPAAEAIQNWRVLSGLLVIALITVAVTLGLWIRFGELRPLATAGFTRFRPAEDLPWFVVGLVFATAVALAIAFGAGTGTDVHALPAQAAADPARLLTGGALIGLVMLPNSIVEELLFRGWALSVIGRRLGLAWAVGLTSAAFGAAHVPPWEWAEPARLLSFVSYAAAGVAFAALALKRRSLYAPIAFHTGFNTLLITAAYAKAGLDPARLLEQVTASPLGAEHLGEAVVWLVVEVAFAALLVWWWRRTPRPASA